MVVIHGMCSYAWVMVFVYILFCVILLVCTLAGVALKCWVE